MSAPRRIRLSRAKGWRLSDHSANCAIVDRRGDWGNPWAIEPSGRQFIVLRQGSRSAVGRFDAQPDAQTFAVDQFRRWLTDDAFAAALPELAVLRDWILGHLHLLEGKDLACWCREGTACHASVLIELLDARRTP